jgi:hypothetical protein
MENAENQWRLDLQSVLNETNQLTISASEQAETVTFVKKQYKKKKVHNDRHGIIRKRSITNPDEMEESKPIRTRHVESDMEAFSDGTKNPDGTDGKSKTARKHVRSKRKDKTKKKLPEQASSETENDHYQADAEMNDKDESDVDPISERIIGNFFVYIYNALKHNDSSHSESNTKEEGCDGDDELTDVEGGRIHVPLFLGSSRVRSRLGQVQPQPSSRSKNQITAMMESNLLWSHNGANKLPGLVARSIRSRSSRIRRAKIKSVNSLPESVSKGNDSLTDFPNVPQFNVILDIPSNFKSSTFGEMSLDPPSGQKTLDDELLPAVPLNSSKVKRKSEDLNSKSVPKVSRDSF